MQYIYKTFAGKCLIALIILFSVASCGSNPSDETISNNISERFKSDSALEGIQVSVNDGTVTLSGTCQGGDCSQKAANLTKEVEGVKAVDNKIKQNNPTDLTLRSSVQTIISKYQGVQADVINNVIVLRGSIERSQVQPLMTELEALKPGKIDNQLAIN